MYTRHFYKLEDVKAALQYAIHIKKPYEAVYWCKEISNISDIKPILFLSWFYSIGLSNLNVIDMIKNATFEDIGTIFQIASIESRDSMLPYVLVNGTLDKTYKIKKTLLKLSSSLKQGNPNIDIWIRNTLYGKFFESWQTSLKVWDDEIFLSMIQTIVNTKFDNPSRILEIIDTLYGFDFIDIIYRRCSVIGILCMDDNMIENALKPEIPIIINMNLYLELWRSVYGKRKGRIFHLYNDCFYGKTKRGLMTIEESNISELSNQHNLIMHQKIHEEIINVYGSYDEFKNNPDQYEPFCECYFPDDIPDEWSLEDKQKSHGNGILEVGELPSIEKFFDIWTHTNENTILKEYSLQYKQTFAFEKDIIQKYYEPFNMKSLQNVLETV